MKKLLARLGLSLLLPGSAAAAPATALAKPVKSCAALTMMEISDIGGKRGKISKAELVTRNGKQVCAVLPAASA